MASILPFLWPMTRYTDDVWTVRNRSLPDFHSTDKGYLVELDLPGLRREDVSIEVSDEDRSVTVRGERKTRTGSHNRVYYGYALPADCDVDNLKASLEDGVLTLECPRMPPQQRVKVRKIEIKTPT